MMPWLPVDTAMPSRFVLPQGKRFDMLVVGAGGTGSWLVPHLARLVYAFNRHEAHMLEKRQASLLIIDPDLVEEKNVTTRQNFCPPEIGYPKAQVLSNRMALAFSLTRDEIAAKVEPFAASMVRQHPSDTVLLVGCVDNADARIELASCLKGNAPERPRICYLDGGNGADWGQIFLGNTATLEALSGSLSDPLCARLPSPALLAPSMFVAPKEEAASTTVQFSCGDLVVDREEGNQQSRTINTHMAALLATYVEQLLYGSVTTFATWTRLDAMETHSSSITPHSIAMALGKEASFASFLTAATDAPPGTSVQAEFEEQDDDDDD